MYEKNYKLVNKTKASDANKISVTRNTVIVVSLIDFLCLFIWLIAAWKTCAPVSFILSNISGVISGLAAFSSVVFGILIVNKGVFSKGGTVYYPTAIGSNKLNKILNDYILKCETPHNDYSIVLETIKDLLKPRGESEFDSPYFDCVYSLQKNEDFSKVWNDFNFYSAKSSMNEKDLAYFKKLKKYIFYKVYEESKK